MHVSSELERVLNMKTQDDASDRIDVMCQYRAVFHPQENRSWMRTVHYDAYPAPSPAPPHFQSHWRLQSDVQNYAELIHYLDPVDHWTLLTSTEAMLLPGHLRLIKTQTKHLW